ncbi:MAG TPA: lysophospholipid acyltransferase family protein [Gammaproteobacteria bacterium]
MARFLVRLLYGSYAWLALLAVVVPFSAALLLAPRLELRRALARGAARLFFLLIGSPVRVEGKPAVGEGPCVVVANHASYLDGIVLTAALPPSFTYLIKHEMARVPIAGFVLRRLGSAFVKRDDVAHRKRVARRLVELAQRGEALAFFPEGTFAPHPGLLPFQPGAFAAAALAEVPVVPLVIQGSRRKLPSGRLLPEPGPLRVRVLDPVDPRRHRSPRELMLAVRRAILEHLDEPDLAPAEASERAA